MIEARDLINGETGHRINYAPYLASCRAIVDSGDLKGFRSDPMIQWMVENMTDEWGYAFAEALDILFPDWMDRSEACLWDKFGDPPLIEIRGRKIAPVTLRYIFRARELDYAFGGLDGKHISEIGGGYGGLAATIMTMFQPASYTIYDVQEPSNLQAEFLASIGLGNVQCWAEWPTDEKNDLVISDHALAELNPDIREKYTETLLRNTKAIAIVWNEMAGVKAPEGRAWLESKLQRRAIDGNDIPWIGRVRHLAPYRAMECWFYFYELRIIS